MITVQFENIEDLEWILRNFVDNIVRAYEPNSPAIDRAIKYYDKVAFQLNMPLYRMIYPIDYK